MTEPEFLAECDRILQVIEDGLDRVEIDVDSERSGNVLTLEFEDASKIIVNGNKQLLDRLAGLPHPSPQEQPDARPGRTLEHRVTQRRDPLKQLMLAAAEGERRRSPGRRLEDMLAAHAAGYSPD